MKKSIKTFWRKLFSPTPKEYKRIRNTMALVGACFASGMGAASTLGISFPDNWRTVIGVIVGVCAFVATWAQSHEEKGGQNGKDNR